MLDILDTAGQEEYVALQKQWIAMSEAIVLVYSISSRSTFNRIKRLHELIQQVRDGRPTPICLIGNKSDRVTEREVSTTEGFDLALSLGIGFFVECSAKNAINVEKAFYDPVRSLRAQQGDSAGLYERRQTVFGSRLIIPAGENETSIGRDRLARSLVNAAKINNLKEVIEFLDAGADINAQPSISGSALHEAAGHGYLTMANLLLKKGAGINARAPSGVSPLQGAASGGHLEVVKSLIQQGANRDQKSPVRGTALHAAASRGQTTVVKYLLKQGADPHEKAGPYEYALHAGSWFGSAGVVNALLDGGADIGQLTEEGCTALHMAAFTGNVNVLQSLINRGAKIYINTVSAKFGTALDAADNNGHFAAVQLLLDGKAEKSGLQPRLLRGRPNLLDPQETNMQGEPSSSADDSEQNVEADTDEQVPEKSKASATSNDISNGVILTSEFDFWFSSTEKAPAKIKPRPPIQDLGFTTLHNPPDARADIVFVHGLQGHPEKTWTFKTEPGDVPLTWRERLLLQRRKQRAAGPSVYWPYDLLCQHEEFMFARIMTWGYDTEVIREFFGGSDLQNISQHSNNLLALAIAKNAQYQPQYLPVYSSVLGIIFLATPHNGSGTAGWGLIASNLTKFALQRPSSSILRGLNPNNEVLENLQRSFLQMLEDGHFTIHSFFETLPMRGIKGLKGLVVPYESAVVGHARKEIFLGITSTHASICKFSGPSDPGYQAVFGALQDYVRASANAELNRPISA
ncbi:RAS-2 [Fusarium albosuccineum]|uniref:RAS-2 n=1 Tax=Fusarium albosuccineum TaxID=1237068 RepID=A0A8H4PHC6_9HYPO|nr:RAS-2 [Fusarium albosuccineum]